MLGAMRIGELLEQGEQEGCIELSALDALVRELELGINGDQPTTMSDVAKRLGIPTTSVKKLEQQGLTRLAERRELQPVGEVD
jgi:DNA-directed RNA polymerase sigma subunit (sigma70/sigma32)